MVDRRLFLIFFALVLFVSVLHAERARNDNREDDDDNEEYEIDSTNNNNNNDDEEAFIETVKRFLLSKKKTTTVKPSTGAISALFTRSTTTTTPASRFTSSSTKSSIFGGFGRKTSSTTSRYSRIRPTVSPTKDACGVVSPCKNGGTCKTLSSGRFYCFCTQDYYGKNCEHKFMSTGIANNDRSAKDHCASSPCRNRGECVGLRTTYYCRCKTPFYGINCDKRLSKREEIIDESNSSEQELNAYERDLQEDTEDLRRALTYEDME